MTKDLDLSIYNRIISEYMVVIPISQIESTLWDFSTNQNYIT